jgi:hypothetical protein
VLPAGAVHDGVDHLGHELLALDDVLRVLLGRDAVVRLDQGQSGQLARGRVLVEVRDGDDLVARVLDVQLGVDRRGGQVGVVVLPADAGIGDVVR